MMILHEKVKRMNENTKYKFFRLKLSFSNSKNFQIQATLLLD